MQKSIMELKNDVASMKQQSCTCLVPTHNRNNSPAKPRTSSLQLRCSTFDGTDPEIWINEVVSFMNFHLVPKEQWVMVALFYLEKEPKGGTIGSKLR